MQFSKSCSSGKLTQSVIDHMKSHHKRVYSAKAVVDTSVPKSMIQIYNGQRNRDRFSQKSTTTFCSLAQSQLSVQNDDEPYLCLRCPLDSSPGLSPSFLPKHIVYESSKLDHSRHTSPRSSLHRKQLTCSPSGSGGQGCSKTFRGPVQNKVTKDMFQKYSDNFTTKKPFTPRILKSNQSSTLGNYRYYRGPRRRLPPDCSDSNVMHHGNNDTSTKNKECVQEVDETSQGFITEHEWSEDEVNEIYLSPPRQQSQGNTTCNPTSRQSAEASKSPALETIFAEQQEELKYLEFISAVTEDILSRTHISDRSLDLVMKRHFDMNQHQLDEGKMRHLLAVLREDFKDSTNNQSNH